MEQTAWPQTELRHPTRVNQGRNNWARFTPVPLDRCVCVWHLGPVADECGHLLDRFALGASVSRFHSMVQGTHYAADGGAAVLDHLREVKDSEAALRTVHCTKA